MYTFVYARGWSYLTDDPAACVNCHVMQGHYDAWVKSSHRSVATCNECHTPHDLLPKYWTKADHGFWHSYGFTTGWFHEPIRMKHSSRDVVEGACRRCHASIVEAIDPHTAGEDGSLSCIRCHDSVGHSN
jgi:cytochrome c nitrite reductase small subunit